jgi:hypothetical protein
LDLKPEESNTFAVAYLILAVIAAIFFSFNFYFYYLIVNRSRILLVEEQRALETGINPANIDKQAVA